MNHPMLMKVYLNSASGALYLVLTWGPGNLAQRCDWESQLLRGGWRASEGLLELVFKERVLSCRFLPGHVAKQGFLLIGRSPGECELQHFHQQLWFHCWDNYGEWVKIHIAILCWGSLSPWNIYTLHWSSPKRWGIWCVFRSLVLYQETRTFLLSYSMF